MRPAPALPGRDAPRAGFTLIEVMAALAILGLSLFVLMDAHYAVLRLHVEVGEEIVMREFVEAAVGKAEMGVLADEMGDAGGFGRRFSDYTWSYEATEAGEDQQVLLYEVNVTVKGPIEERTLQFFVYNTGVGASLPVAPRQIAPGARAGAATRGGTRRR